MATATATDQLCKNFIKRRMGRIKVDQDFRAS